MRISIVGAGRVATHLANALATSHSLLQIYSRNVDKAQQLAAQVSAQAIACIEGTDGLNPDVDVIFICVSDQAIADVAAGVAAQVKAVGSLSQRSQPPLMLHCSGSTDLDVLRQYYAHCGVMYPLQTFSLEKKVDWAEVPLLLESNIADDLPKLQQLANSLSAKQYVYDSAQRLSLHLAAVFACNFSNYCYSMAAQVANAAQIDFALLHPLMLETAEKATQFEPKCVQTGPAVRGDVAILQKHMQMLSQQKQLQDVYQLLSQQIQTQH